MSDDEKSAMIALLPVMTDWCKLECPHLTLVYAGEIPDLEPTAFNKMAKDAAALAMISRPITLQVLGVEVFGDVEKVDVFRLVPSSELLAMRNFVESWNKSEFSFKPHVTIGAQGSSISIEHKPNFIAFDRIMVGWGDEKLTFWLRR